MVQLTDKHWAIPIPDNANGITIGNHYFGYYEGEPTFKAIRTMPLPGNWQFLFTTKEATEVDVAKVVEKVIHPNEPIYYKIYDEDSDAIATTHWHYSFETLLKAKGCDVSKNWAIIQKL